MPDQKKYKFPEFISNEFNMHGLISENDSKIIEDIYIKSENFNYPFSNTDTNWLRLKNTIDIPELKPELTIVKNTFYYMARWAAAAIIVIAVTIGIFQFNKISDNYKPLVESTTGSLKKIVLPDGSIVTLNSFSTISVSDFDSDERIVSLSGEAYFEVKPDAKPFIVKTTTGNIQVLGTKFNVKSRINIPFQVALLSGKISLTTSAGTYLMAPGDIITEEINNSYIKSQINNSTLGWLEQKLVFENETLFNIVQALEGQYNVTLEYDANLKSEKLTLTFDNLTIQQAADLLSKTLNSRVVIK